MSRPAMASSGHSALVLFASETGNGEDLAIEVGRVCERLGFSTSVQCFNSARIADLTGPSFIVTVVSTTGQGDIPANAQEFWKALKSVRLQPGCLWNVIFASFGLGDSSYPKFNWAHRKLHNRLRQLGANQFCDRGESDEQHPEGIDGTFVPWLASFKASVIQRFQLSHDGIIPDNVPLPPKWTLQFTADTTIARTSSGRVSIPGSLFATVQSNARLTPETHFQDTRHLALTVPGRHEYLAGSTVTIYPRNDPLDVEAFLRLMSWADIADRPLKFTPESEKGERLKPPVCVPAGEQLTLRRLASNHLDIMSIPKRSFFKELLHYATDQAQLERLREFVSPDLIDELYDYTTRPRRSILETLNDFTSAKLPWRSICDIIPCIRGRRFSVASGGTLKYLKRTASAPTISNGVSETHIELLIAIVKYQTIIRRTRYGLCTRYISSLEPGDQLPISLQPASALGIVPGDVSKPVLMVAPGTGVAPMRALCWDRKSWRNGKTAADGHEDILMFGCRNQGVDEYFSDEWRDLGIQAYSAFSRDQKEKVYVQDLLKQHSKDVYTILAEKGGQILVCGSSGRMPQAVRNALVEVFQKEGGMGMEDAEAYLRQMEKMGRYKQETW